MPEKNAESCVKLRVLITNCILDGGSGTEMYVYDLACWLRQQGHTPIAFSPQLGRLAERLAFRSIPVVDSLDKIAQPPDIIHGHHTLETVEALLHFPAAPALFVCHDCDAWHDTPPEFARIRQYVAVDQTCADRLILTHGIKTQRVSVLGNPVDLSLFKPRPPLPKSPRRAVVFSSYGSHRSVRPIRDACDECGITLDLIGKNFGTMCETPQETLPQYDLVFAKGRCAREALAVGCAVVYGDTFGLGAMFTRDTVQQMNTGGRRELLRPLSKELLVEEIRRYDPQDAAAVSRYIRANNNPGAIYDQLLELYRRIIDEHGTHSSASMGDELREASRFLKQWSAIQRRLMIQKSRPPWLQRKIVKLRRSLSNAFVRR